MILPIISENDKTKNGRKMQLIKRIEVKIELSNNKEISDHFAF